MKIIGNPSQWEAISHARGPCEVIAGPGSGKTFVLVHHILFLLQDLRADPSQILVLTFSKAAAKDMRRRFYHDLRSSNDFSLSPESASQITFGTFHSVFYRILQSSSRTNLKIIDEKTHTKLLRFLAREYLQAGSGIDGSADRIVMEELAGAITHAKNRADQGPTHACEPSDHDSRSSGRPSLKGRKPISENSFHESTSSGGPSSAVQMPVSGREKPQYEQAVALYNRYLRENGLMDYDDIVLECRRLFMERPDVLALWRAR
ncbi:MAG: ATP-dependent helicase, partial [Lachnospiraceae bacterium]|nr:ATP-dependent helicase [Lachnospiraceae bacterium]